ncbi:hypothetical protein COCC4DRAFT_64903 [Bipolaris maydis ATCC 48331]|uniref:Uncharacterized protein n=2 Tax=Cochliobolus heterostrophus TaxID=5016 RepID=M2VCW5_COCH5|nr:uncharacterized protein COCC4DRAFT_64903 [Bipolaris maydis ATCC 48331]EMD96405.1 hypothetical protein COCHEDRAFT_1084785 [Bipolaris maydis C5]EMD97573.1 hypothetical protein COCHEDRAFT_1083849 [Bipolaris maydis C5]ENI01070.1 hypothetical protein COCC4DRAFT_64903 [Bipolaris maydis ATCC 48331]KAJ6211060.1 hypothetical protein PSV09DRAFT_1083849 [Bipolaris maydis]
MLFRTAIISGLLVALSMTNSVEARKCACQGGPPNSQAACSAIGASYGYGCGFSGCCVNPGTQESRFRSMCVELGFGFLRCNECPTC